MTRASIVQLRNERTVGRCPHGPEARLTPGGWTCLHGPTATPEPRRLAGHGSGLDGPVCPQRQLPQLPDGVSTYRTRMCARCGRITARLDADGVGWCGGEMPVEYLPAGARVARALMAVSS